jgi:peptidoglycan/LPS O-acetylase OafA/YrhL
VRSSKVNTAHGNAAASALREPGSCSPAGAQLLRAPAAISLPQPVRITPIASAYLDSARALAAFAVMFGHVRGLYFTDFRSIQPALATPAVKFLWLVTGFGHQSVMVFFVLSGFFIASSVLRKLGNGAWQWRTYAIDRGTRLYAVLIPGLLLGLVWDALGIAYFNATGTYSSPLIPFGNSIVVDALRPINFIGNLFFLQTRFTPVFGSNGPLWSLYNEFWYYVLFPALLLLIVSVARRSIRTVLLYGFIVLVTIWILGAQLSGFAVWMLGCAVALTARYVRFPSSRHWYARLYSSLSAALFVSSLLAARQGSRWLGSDFVVGLSFALLLHGVVQIGDVRGHFGIGLAKTFAGFSYSLYVLHFPLLLLIRSAWLGSSRWQPDTIHLAYSFCVSVAVLFYAFGVAQVTEMKTPTIRAWVLARVGCAPKFSVEANCNEHSRT